jgi:uncharacterized membrane protein YhhN
MILVIPFFLISIFHIYFIIKNHPRGRYITKPLLMPLLLLLYVFNVEQSSLWIVLALVASFLGDVFLMRSNAHPFILAGIASFMAGHIFYMIAFLKVSGHIPLWFWLWIIPYMAVGILLGRRLFPSMSSMRVPAAIYMGVILFMSFISLTLILSVSFLPFIGSLLFIVSDSLLAFDMFTDKKLSNHASIMMTYILAQFLIVLGFML